MRKIILKCILLICMIFTTFSICFIVMTVGLGAKFNNLFCYVINDKYNNLIHTESPKIILVSGSSGAFGANADIIEKKTGYKFANISLHAGFGMKFETELSKGNIKKGDLVILSYEYDRWSADNPSVELIMTGIDDNISLYKYVPSDVYYDLLKYFPKYIFKKVDEITYKPAEYGGIYARAAFDKDGNVIFDRNECLLDKNSLNPTVLTKDIVADDMIEYVNKFNKYVKKKGATLLISFPPLVKESVVSSQSEINSLQDYLNEKLDAPIISNINDYLFGIENFYDTVYHMNNQGAILRSNMLSLDVTNYVESVGK